MTLSARAQGALAALLLAAHGILAWLARSTGIATGRDDAKYLLLSRSLRELHYREIWTVAQAPHAQYPPGYPAALGLWALLFGERFDTLVLLGILCSVASLALAWWVVRRRVDPGLALLALAALAFNPNLIAPAGTLASEPLFTLLCVAALAVLAHDAPRPGLRVAAGALAIAATLTRSAGVPLLAAVGLWFLSQRRWRDAAAFAAATVAVVGAWFWWTVRYAPRAAGESYVGDAMMRVRHGSSAVQQMITRAGDYVFQGIPYSLPMPTIAGTLVDNIVLASAAILGLVVGSWLFWRAWRAALFWALLTLAMLLVWTWTSRRFLAPTLPVLVPAFLAGIGAVAGWRWPRARLQAVALAALVLAVTGAVRTWRLVEVAPGCVRGRTPPVRACLPPDQASYLDAAEFLRDSLPQGTRVMSVKPEPIYYYSNQRGVAVGVALARDSNDVVRTLHAERTNYILLGSVGSGEPSRLRPRLQQICPRLAIAANFPPRTWLFRVKADDEPPDSTACRALAAYQRANLGRNLNLER